MGFAKHRRWLTLFILVFGLSSTGCTLIGLGIGAAVPREEHDVPLDKLKSYEAEGKSLDVDVQLRPGAAAEDRVVGRWGGQTEKELVVLTNEGFHHVVHRWTIPLEDVQRVDVRKGSYWATGLGVGAAVDGTLVGLFLLVLALVVAPR